MKKATMPRTATPPATLRPTMVLVETPSSSSLLLLEPALEAVELAALAEAVGVSEMIWTTVEPCASVVTMDDGVGVAEAAALEPGEEAAVVVDEPADDWVVEELWLEVVVDEAVVEDAVVLVGVSDEVVEVDVALDAELVVEPAASPVLESSPKPNTPARLCSSS